MGVPISHGEGGGGSMRPLSNYFGRLIFVERIEGEGQSIGGSTTSGISVRDSERWTAEPSHADYA